MAPANNLHLLHFEVPSNRYYLLSWCFLVLILFDLWSLADDTGSPWAPGAPQEKTASTNHPELLQITMEVEGGQFETHSQSEVDRVWGIQGTYYRSSRRSYSIYSRMAAYIYIYTYIHIYYPLLTAFYGLPCEGTFLQLSGLHSDFI